MKGKISRLRVKVSSYIDVSKKKNERNRLTLNSFVQSNFMKYESYVTVYLVKESLLDGYNKFSS